jgi:hypothetical protein
LFTYGSVRDSVQMWNFRETSDQFFPNAKSNIVTSIVRYHLYFHMTRFMRNPILLDRYITEDDIRTIRKFAPVKETSDRRYESSHANIGTWYYDKPPEVRNRIRNQKYIRRKYGGTSIQFEYLTAISLYDVNKISSGLTKTGQKLFQQSIESFVYAVLGSQAKTRWSIVG